MQRFDRKRKILLAILTLLFACCLFAACSDVYRPEEHGYTALVVYDADGGRYSNSDETGVRTFRYKPGVSIMEPGGSAGTGFNLPTRDSMHVVGWYPAVLDEAGEPVKEDGAFVLEEEAWDFANDRLPEEEGYKLYLVAAWAKNYSLTIDVGEEARAEGVKNIVYTNYSEAGPVAQPGIDPERPGYTFHYYYTEEGKQLRTAEDWESIVLSDENPEITVYVQWLQGDWNFIRTADDINAIPAFDSENYMLDADIDMGGQPFKLEMFGGVFDGNGFTIRNFVTSDNQFMSSSSAYGICSFLGGTMKNVTFENGSYSVQLSRELPGEEAVYTVGFFAGDGSSLDLSAFTDIGFKNCSLTVTKIGAALEETVLTGSGSWAGIFGKLGENQTFTPAAGSDAIVVKV